MPRPLVLRPTVILEHSTFTEKFPIDIYLKNLTGFFNLLRFVLLLIEDDVIEKSKPSNLTKTEEQGQMKTA